MKTTIPQKNRTQAGVVGNITLVFDEVGDLWLHACGPADEVASIRVSGEDVEKLAEVLSAVVEDHLAWLDAGDEVET
jgi:hypothetical protein